MQDNSGRNPGFRYQKVRDLLFPAAKMVFDLEDLPSFQDRAAFLARIWEILKEEVTEFGTAPILVPEVKNYFWQKPFAEKIITGQLLSLEANKDLDSEFGDDTIWRETIERIAKRIAKSIHASSFRIYFYKNEALSFSLTFDQPPVVEEISAGN